MIRHYVLFKVNPEITDVEIDKAFQLLFSLKNKLQGFLRVAAGKCKFHENRGQINRLYGFSIDFKNEEAYNSFLSDPVTHPAKEALLNMIVDGYQGLFGFDVGRVIAESYPNPLEKYRTPTLKLRPPGTMM